MKAFQFKVILANFNGLYEQLVNCATMDEAQFIAEGLHPDMRVIEILKN